MTEKQEYKEERMKSEQILRKLRSGTLTEEDLNEVLNIAYKQGLKDAYIKCQEIASIKEEGTVDRVWNRLSNGGMSNEPKKE